MLLVGAACSRSYTGFDFGVDKYAYDLPMVAWLFDEPQFASDTLMQSPRHLASGVLRGSAFTAPAPAQLEIRRRLTPLCERCGRCPNAIFCDGGGPATRDAAARPRYLGHHFSGSHKVIARTTALKAFRSDALPPRSIRRSTPTLKTT
jgi:hypothetical protein